MMEMMVLQTGTLTAPYKQKMHIYHRLPGGPETLPSALILVDSLNATERLNGRKVNRSSDGKSAGREEIIS